MGCKMNSLVACPINRQIGTGERFGRSNASCRLNRDKLRERSLRLRGADECCHGYR